jgi:hypothetical protein
MVLARGWKIYKTRAICEKTLLPWKEVHFISDPTIVIYCNLDTHTVPWHASIPLRVPERTPK